MARTRTEPPVASAGADKESEEAPKVKKARASKEAAKAKQSKAQARLKVLEVQTAPLEHALSVAQPPMRADREAALHKHLDKVYEQQLLVKAATDAVELACKGGGRPVTQGTQGGRDG